MFVVLMTDVELASSEPEEGATARRDVSGVCSCIFDRTDAKPMLKKILSRNAYVFFWKSIRVGANEMDFFTVRGQLVQDQSSPCKLYRITMGGARLFALTFCGCSAISGHSMKTPTRSAHRPTQAEILRR
jgi:hypothetical protein